MTTISPNRRRASRTSRVRFVLYAIACVLALVALLLWREGLAGILWRVEAPLLGARTELAASGDSFFSRFSSQAALTAQNEALRAALASSTITLMDRDLLYAENLQLKERLNRLPTGQAGLASSTHSTLATIILRPPGVPYDTLMLDVGSGEGVVVGDLVAAGGSVYIGRISQVYAGASRATLFSAPGETHDAVLIAASSSMSVPLSVMGQGGASLTGEVPAGTPVAVGDSVVLANLGIEFIARVTAVDSAAEKSFKTVYLQLPVNPLELRFVEVRHAPGLEQ